MSHRKSHSRSSRHASRAGVIHQRPFGAVRNPYRPMELISTDQVEVIHHASLQVLRDIGMRVNDAPSLALMEGIGAEVDRSDNRVRLDPALVEETITGLPSEFTIHARNPAHSIRMGGDWMAFGNVSSPPNCSDMDNGRRVGNLADYRKFLKLTQYFNCIHFMGGYPVEPVDVHASVRHLHAAYDAHTLTDKSFHVYSLGKQRNLDGIEMARTAGFERIKLNTVVLAGVNDDEVADPDWLAQLLATAQTYQADAVFGRVKSTYPSHTPQWIIESGAFELPICLPMPIPANPIAPARARFFPHPSS